MFHCALSRVMPRQAMGTESKLTALGGVSVGCLTMSFTAGVDDLVVAGVGRSVWIPCSRRDRCSAASCNTSASRSKLAAVGDEVDPACELTAGEFLPEYAGADSSEISLVARGVFGLTPLGFGLRLRGPPGRILGDRGPGERDSRFICCACCQRTRETWT